MTHRLIADIFPAYYSWMPDEEEIARKCRARFATAQRVEDLTRWMEHESCPYMREAYAEGMRQTIANAIDEDDEDLRMNANVREEVEDNLNRIIRYSRTDQLAEEMCQTEQPIVTSNVPREQHMTAMERQMAYLTQEVATIKNQLAQSNSAILWPMYAPNIDESDKQAFENQLRTICRSGKRDLTQSIKTYLNIKQKDGTILRPTQQNTEWEILKQFGYPFTKKAYYNS